MRGRSASTRRGVKARESGDIEPQQHERRDQARVGEIHDSARVSVSHRGPEAAGQRPLPPGFPSSLGGPQDLRQTQKMDSIGQLAGLRLDVKGGSAALAVTEAEGRKRSFEIHDGDVAAVAGGGRLTMVEVGTASPCSSCMPATWPASSDSSTD